MELKEIASISGKSGLFKVLKPSKAGVILESIDEKKQKMVAGVHHKVSILEEISVYVNTSEGSIPLQEVFERIFKEFEDDPGLDSSSTPDEFKAFFKHILPEYEESKVYVSDMKKIINWYSIVLREAPEIIKEAPKKEKEEKADKEKSKKSEEKKEAKTSEPGKSTTSSTDSKEKSKPLKNKKKK